MNEDVWLRIVFAVSVMVAVSPRIAGAFVAGCAGIELLGRWWWP